MLLAWKRDSVRRFHLLAKSPHISYVGRTEEGVHVGKKIPSKKELLMLPSAEEKGQGDM